MSINKRGFTLVELLSAITILGVLSILAINGIVKLIDKAREDRVEHNRQTLVMAAESYMQSNRSALPKSIGETVSVNASTLKDTKYLKDSITNSKGESCMNKSFVKVYKQSKTKYKYTGYIYCGSDVVPSEDAVDMPVIKVLFANGNYDFDDSVSTDFNNVSDAWLYIDIKGNNSNSLAIDGYNYSILAKINGKQQEVYSSGTLSANGSKSLKIKKKLSDYIDITTATEFVCEVTANNVDGGVASASSNNSKYDDKISPTCVKDSIVVSPPAVDSGQDSWIKKGDSNGRRKVTVSCTDGNGSGCVRDTFTRSFPNSKSTYKGGEYIYVQVKDNAGNYNVGSGNSFITTDPCTVKVEDGDSNCRVKVNVDVEKPTVNVKSSSFNGTKVASDSSGNLTIESNSYKNLVNGWMNKANYPDGATFTFTISDDLHLASWKWETNPSYVNSKSSSNYNNFSLDNPDALKSVNVIAQPDMTKNNCGTRTVTNLSISLKGEGMRKGRLTVTDEAGNDTVVYVEANIDRTAPKVPATSAKKWKTNSNSTLNSAYTWAKWSNLYVGAYVDASYKQDSESNNTTLSGWDAFYFKSTNEKGTVSSETKGERCDFNNKFQGKNKIQFKSCDKAGNCSSYNSNKEVWIDTVGPTCNGASGGSTTWSKAASRKVGEKCTDTHSGCTASVFETTVTNQCKTKSVAITIRDNAGNTTVCTRDRNIYLDRTAPTCGGASEGTPAWSNAASRTVGEKCSDTLSGCSSNVFTTQVYNETKTKTLTITIKDNVGNTKKCTRNHNVYLDRTPPNCGGCWISVRGGCGAYYNQTYSDNLSGLGKAQSRHCYAQEPLGNYYVDPSWGAGNVCTNEDINLAYWKSGISINESALTVTHALNACSARIVFSFWLRDRAGNERYCGTCIKSFSQCGLSCDP